MNRYNCIAWAADNDTRWWWPDAANIGYWPPSVPRVETIDAFIQAYATEGYVPCADGSVEAAMEKVAIFGVMIGGDIYPTHAARQLPDGKWTSKLGGLEDVTHDSLNAISGGRYGAAVCYIARTRRNN